MSYRFIMYVDAIRHSRNLRRAFLNVRRFTPSKLKSYLVPRHAYATHKGKYDVVAACFRYVHVRASHGSEADRKKWGYVEDRLIRRYATYYRHKTHDRL